VTAPREPDRPVLSECLVRTLRGPEDGFRPTLAALSLSLPFCNGLVTYFFHAIDPNILTYIQLTEPSSGRSRA